jgi:hypothetical protein
MGNHSNRRECSQAIQTCVRQDIIVCGANTDEILLACRAANARCTPEPVEAKRSRINQQLLAASSCGNVAGVQQAILQGALLETRRPLRVSTVPENFSVSSLPKGMTPLMYSVYEGHEDCTAILLEARANANAKDEEGICPLHFAATRGSIELAEMLLSARANPLHQDLDGRDALGHLPDCVPHSEWRELLGNYSGHRRPENQSAKSSSVSIFGGKLQREGSPASSPTTAADQSTQDTESLSLPDSHSARAVAMTPREPEYLITPRIPGHVVTKTSHARWPVSNGHHRSSHDV